MPLQQVEDLFRTSVGGAGGGGGAGGSSVARYSLSRGPLEQL